MDVVPRRGVLAAGATLLVAGLAGCRVPLTSAGPKPDPDVDLLKSALADELHLVALYSATLTQHPSLADRLGPVADEHRAHAAALTSAVRRPVRAGATAPASPPTTPPPAPLVVPGTEVAAVAALVAQERARAGALAEQCAPAGPLAARLLAGIGGAEAVHAALLGLPASSWAGKAAS